MTDSHNQTFFGQKTGLIINSKSKDNPFLYIRCIKKKNNGEWEKISEGKSIKLSLIELIAISDVLNRKKKIWSTFHKYGDSKTPISFAWDEHDNELLWINIDEYARPLNYPETELLTRLFNHIVEEKIIFSTSNRNSGEKRIQIKDEEITIKNESNVPIPQIRKNYDMDFISQDNIDTISLVGKIKISREKAILLILENDMELWVPKSTILNSYDSKSMQNQEFIIKKWILQKRNIVI